MLVYFLEGIHGFFFSELRFTGNNQLIKQTKKEMRF